MKELPALTTMASEEEHYILHAKINTVVNGSYAVSRLSSVSSKLETAT
jgi:hypothetical protein